MQMGTLSICPIVLLHYSYNVYLVQSKNPTTAEEDVIREICIFANGEQTISKNGLEDWMYKIHPEFDDDLLEHLADGADVDGDDDIHYSAYVRLVCQQILNLNDTKVCSYPILYISLYFVDAFYRVSQPCLSQAGETTFITPHTISRETRERK